MLPVRGGGAGGLAYRSVIEVEVEGSKDWLWGRNGKLPSGPDGKALTAARERNGLQAVVAKPIAAREKASKNAPDLALAPQMAPDSKTTGSSDSSMRAHYLHRLMGEPFKNQGDLEYSYISFRHGAALDEEQY
ncbi:hypothetical protein HOY80DRAFT_1038342 [Tuber brumale]|nr:hypothetical protein HOY80DRAFT_1038342 [Tuber brumale]